MKRARKRRKRTPTASGETLFFPGVQKKLKVGTPGDRFEVEADKTADAVVDKASDTPVQKMEGEEESVQQKPLATTITPLKKNDLQREAGSVQKMEEEPAQAQEEEEAAQTQEEEEAAQTQEEEEAAQMEEEEEQAQTQEEEEAQAKAAVPTKASGIVESTIKSSKGSGSKMDPKTKAEMERGFGADFSKVKIHTGTKAEQMSSELGAQAFTHGNDIYFNKGKYDPESKKGKHLLAHELTHTIQQTGMVQRAIVEKSSPNLEADRFKGNFRLEQAHDDVKYIRKGSQGLHVSKLQKGLVDIGFNLPQYGVDGIFGSETEGAVVRFQNAFDLSIDGIVGAQTMGTLDDVHSSTELGSGCCVDLFELPQRDVPFTVPAGTEEIMIKFMFCTKSNFNITSKANWASPHFDDKYFITISAPPKSVRKPFRRFDIGKTETQSVQIKKDCVEFKILVKVRNPDDAPALNGKFSLTN